MSGSEEQVERVARAIAERHGHQLPSPLHPYTEGSRTGEYVLDARAAIAAMQSDGIPVLRMKDATPDIRPTCVTCGQSFDLQDPEQVAYHDQEGEHPPMK